MKSPLILLALLASGQAVAQHYTACGISSEYKHAHWAECAQEREEARRPMQPPIPDRWSTDQDDREARCYHRDDSPDRNRLIEECLAIVRRAR